MKKVFPEGVYHRNQEGRFDPQGFFLFFYIRPVFCFRLLTRPFSAWLWNLLQDSRLPLTKPSIPQYRLPVQTGRGKNIDVLPRYKPIRKN
jgi:hypothetical protein